MLILSRRSMERILIGENVVLTVAEISGGRVKIGFEAPRDVSIVRAEIHRDDDNTLRKDSQ